MIVRCVDKLVTLRTGTQVQGLGARGRKSCKCYGNHSSAEDN